MYCNYCGNKLEEGVKFCGNCGARVEAEFAGKNDGTTQNSFNNSSEDLSGRFSSREHDPALVGRNPLLAVACFIVPLLGLILWAVMRDTRPGLAMSAAKGALASLCFGTPILGLIFFFVWRDGNPELSKTAGISAIVGFVSSLLLIPMLITFFLMMGIDLEVAMLSLPLGLI